MGLEEHSYKIHQNLYTTSEIKKQLGVYKGWFDRATTDLWRHKRMLSVLDHFLKNHSNAKWLTVGDGRFGTSASYIDRNGSKALATDIDVTLLEIAKQNNMLNDFAFANAEKLPFADEQFDYAYCKQSYHHFPRPILAIYEMLRVSKQAIIFTEPHDYVPAPFIRSALQKIKHLLKKMIGKKIEHHDTGNYETIGNYIYTISLREMEKIAQGIGLPCIAYKLFHDEYFVGVENEIFSDNAPLYKKIRSAINRNRLKTALRITNPNTVQMIIFKTKPTDLITTSLEKDRYTIVTFPGNPYI